MKLSPLLVLFAGGTLWVVVICPPLVELNHGVLRHLGQAGGELLADTLFGFSWGFLVARWTRE